MASNRSCIVFAASALLAWSTPTPPAGADVIGMDQWPGDDIGSLYLDDGTWDRGEDWYYEILNGDGVAWMYEHWIHMRPVDLISEVDTDGKDPDVTIHKDVLNDTNFDWTDFHIDLLPQEGTGPIVVYPDSVSSDRFSDIDVTNNGDGSANISFFTDAGAGDTPVLIGESAMFSFTFNIPADVRFKMIQTPTPEPGFALAVLGIGAWLGRRRRCR